MVTEKSKGRHVSSELNNSDLTPVKVRRKEERSLHSKGYGGRRMKGRGGASASVKGG